MEEPERPPPPDELDGIEDDEEPPDEPPDGIDEEEPPEEDDCLLLAGATTHEECAHCTDCRCLHGDHGQRPARALNLHRFSSFPRRTLTTAAAVAECATRQLNAG